MLLPPQRATRRATLSQSRTRLIGLDGHKASLAGASGAPPSAAPGTAPRPTGTPPGDAAPRRRQRPAQAPPLFWVSEAGPWGYGLARERRHKASACWGGVPSLLPTQAGARGNTARRDALHLARLARS